MKDDGGSNLDLSKDRSISAMDRPIFTKFGSVMQLCPGDPISK